MLKSSASFGIGRGLVSLARRSKIWITKNEVPVWKFSEGVGGHMKDYINAEQFQEAIQDLATLDSDVGDKPFRVCDVREAHERQIKDIITEVEAPGDGSVSVEIPRSNVQYDELITGLWNAQMFSRR